MKGGIRLAHVELADDVAVDADAGLIAVHDPLGAAGGPAGVAQVVPDPPVGCPHPPFSFQD